MGLLDFFQGASNAAAGNVSGPVDAIAWALRKAGVPVGDAPMGGSQWMAQMGLTRPANGYAGLLGEAAGLSMPIVAAAKAPQIARGLLSLDDKAMDMARQGVERAMLANGGIQPATVWHGSPHNFDKFDSSKIGTGEGAQAYGHGLYLAESPDVAESYRKSLTNLYGTPTTIEGGGRSVPIPLWAADQIDSQGIDSVIKEWTKRAAESKARAKTSLQPWIDESNAQRFADQLTELQAIKASGAAKVQPAGSLYKVDLPDNAIAKMLDWDKPLSQQSPEVQSGVRKVLIDRGQTPAVADYIIQNKTGRDALSTIGRGSYDARLLPPDGEAAAQSSNWLKSQGIPGIRYLDGGSRGTGAGTSNYVIFPGNENMLTILERNGQPVSNLGLGK